MICCNWVIGLGDRCLESGLFRLDLAFVEEVLINDLDPAAIHQIGPSDRHPAGGPDPF